MRSTCFVVMFACLSTACASSGVKPIKRSNPWPKQEALAKLEKEAPAEEVFEKREEVRVDTWKLTGPLPQTIGLRERAPSSDWEKELAAELGDDDVMSEGMHCAAREVGLFYVEYGALPFESLKSFIRMRCGVVSNNLATGWLFWEEKVGDAEAWKNRTDYFVQQARAIAKTQHAETGIWFGGNENASIAILAYGQRTVDLREMSMATAETGVFDIHGEILIAGDEIGALVNEGDYDFRYCQTLPGAKAPKFHIRCKANPDDRSATFGVAAARKDAVHARAVLLQQVWPAQAPEDTYYARGIAPQTTPPPTVEPQPEAEPEPEPTESAATAETDGEPTPMPPYVPPPNPQRVAYQPAASSADVQKRFVERLNGVRQTAGRPAVTLSAEQSKTADGVADTYFSSVTGKYDPDAIDEITLGLLAGWDVEGAIINGDFVSDYTFTGDPDELLDRMLERPGGRKALLDEEVDTIAIGSYLETKSRSLGAIVNSYRFVREADHRTRINRLFATLNAQRQAFGSGIAKVESSSRPLADSLSKKVSSGELKLHEATGQLLSRKTGNLRYYMFEANELEEIQFPEDLVKRDPLILTAMIAVYQPAGFPWHVHGIVLIMKAGKAPTKVATK